MDYETRNKFGSPEGIILLDCEGVLKGGLEWNVYCNRKQEIDKKVKIYFKRLYR